MSITRYNPNDFVPVPFSNFLGTLIDGLDRTTQLRTFVPRANVLENKNSFIIRVDMPGMRKDDFKIELNDSFLTVSGKREEKVEQKNENFHLLETNYGSFSRSFTIPENIETEVSKIKALYNNGILEITLLKNKEKEPVQIAVEVA